VWTDLKIFDPADFAAQHFFAQRSQLGNIPLAIAEFKN
jgi:hypothetical protein